MRRGHLAVICPVPGRPLRAHLASLKRVSCTLVTGLGLSYDVGMATRDQRDGIAVAEAVRIRRLREDARRPISVNLAETIALSHALIKMAGAAKRR